MSTPDASALPQLLGLGFPPDDVVRRHVEASTELVAKGISWQPMKPAQRDQVTAFLAEQLPEAPQVEPSQAAVLALDADQQLVAAVVVGAMVFEEQLSVAVAHLAVAPQWRGQGLGLVTLQLAERVDLPKRPTFFFANVAADQARFFRAAGYTVTQPGQAIIVPGAPVRLASSSDVFPCMAYRGWSLSEQLATGTR